MIQKIWCKKRQENRRRESKFEKNHWLTPGFHIQIWQLKLFFSAKYRVVPRGAIKPIFARLIRLMTSENERENKWWSDGDERILKKTRLERTVWRKDRKGTPNPLTMIAVGFPCGHFSRISSSLYTRRILSSPFTVRVSLNDNVDPLTGHAKTTDKPQTKRYINYVLLEQINPNENINYKPIYVQTIMIITI